ncbi:MAG: NUDIX hydrolase [Solirubrobacterales bacterium]|nr:NUDIX hydrolase [Solirubrobacterales bacterium]
MGRRPVSRRRPLDAQGEPEVRAAGGVIVDSDSEPPLLAVVHRPRYDDWSLPKGKLEPGEGWEHAALREVWEETGLRCELVRELEPTSYEDRRGRSKLVRWWTMLPLGGQFAPNDEVDQLRWLPLAEAERVLTHGSDRDLARAALA